MINAINKEKTITEIESVLSEKIRDKELWGDIDFSTEEYDILKDKMTETFKDFQYNVTKIYESYPVAMTTLLVFLVRYKYNTNFWGLVEKELSIIIDGPIQNYIGRKTKQVFSHFGFDYSDAKRETWVNIAPIIYEAGLPPESSLDDLFYVLKYDSQKVFDPQLIIDDLINMRSYAIRKPLLRFLKRFQETRAIEFLLEVNDAMLSIDCGLSSESPYIAKYSEWKAQEKTKERTANRKKTEFQTRPYLSFENGKRGLCIVLPRTILNDEWVQSVSWSIINAEGIEVVKNLAVFGDEGQRYIESITVPIKPSEKYKIALIDNESIVDDNIFSWIIDGVKEKGVAFFNANGRMITPKYIPYPYGIMILGENATISKSEHVVQTYQIYPTSASSEEEYRIVAIEPMGRNATLTYCANGIENTLCARPQITLQYVGKSLFSLPINEEYSVFTEIPHLVIEVEEGIQTEGLELRVAGKILSLDSLFEGNKAVVPLKAKMHGVFVHYGMFNVRLYQKGIFLKQKAFYYVPPIKTDYNPSISWPDYSNRFDSRIIKFKKSNEYHLEFANGTITDDEDYYTVDCGANVGSLGIKLKAEDDTYFCTFNIPINPFYISVIDDEGEVDRESNNNLLRIDLEDLKERDYWINIEFFGDYKNYYYSLRLINANGIDQNEEVSLSQNASVNFNIKTFLDTLNNSPLPAQLELCCKSEKEKSIPLLIVVENTQLANRPMYIVSNDTPLLLVSAHDIDKDIVIRRFGLHTKEYQLTPEKIKTIQSGDKTYFAFECPEKLRKGIYIIDTELEDSIFDFGDVILSNPSNGKSTLYVPSRPKDSPILTVSNWIDQLTRDVLSSGYNKDIVAGKAYCLLNKLKNLDKEKLSNTDYELLIALAYFLSDKCCEDKKTSIKRCMQAISEDILDSTKRLEMVRVLADLNCSQEIFDICLDNYNLLLFLTGSKDSKMLAEKLESKSTELSLLLRMGIDDSIRNTIWKEKYRELIGKEAIRTMLSVPEAISPSEIVEEQKKFLKGQRPCKVQIYLSSEISGEMKPIQDMIEFKKNQIIMNLAKRPDTGIYFAHIRYVDQYINWYTLNHNKNGEMPKWMHEMMVNLVKEDCQKIINGVKLAKSIESLREMLNKYEDALVGRFDGDVMESLFANRPDRFFYLQGLAAFLSKLPEEYQHYDDIVKPAQHFMNKAMVIAPRIARRDLVMASTYIYLVRKEEQLCQ